ncbi:MAG TPA: hypothetical protein VKV17_08765 [Bryobacteraceae bacterium]|nr:hypothetical protein [Bryobacteraceae bacterium]
MITLRSISFTGIALAGLAAATHLLAQPQSAGQGFRGGRGLGGFGFGPGLPSFAAKTITGAPFSASLTNQSTQTLANGTQIQRQSTGEVARDSQGRVYLQVSTTRPTSSGNQTVSSITIYDPVAGYIYRLNPQKMTGVEMPFQQRTPPPATNGPSAKPETQTTNLGTQTINGVTATGTQVTRTIPAGAIGNTQPIAIVRITWVSTALQIPVQVTQSDPRSGSMTMNLTNIVQSEPSASLFTVPSGYTVTTASLRARSRGRF